MTKQPAQINYFFKGGYVELWRTVCETFSNLGDDIAGAWYILADGWVDFWSSFFTALGSIIGLDIEWDEIGTAMKGICKFAFGLGKLVFILVITTSLCFLLSLAHAIILLAVMAVAYFFFLIWLLSDTIYCALKRISNNCRHCQRHFSLPVYTCPDCGVEHSQLRPSKYGIWKRTCECGCKLPTTFLNGRGKLDAFCPYCNTDIEAGGQHVSICVPVVGGASSGKTCFIHQSIDAVSRSAASWGLTYRASANAENDFESTLEMMQKGYLPEKTNEMRLKYFDFNLLPPSGLPHLLSLCDVGGEIYSDSQILGEQIAFEHANGFLMILDPLSVTAYREEASKTIDPKAYGYSNERVDEIVSMLISTLENMKCTDAKQMLKTDIAVVFTKLDIPGLDKLIGKAAVDAYRKNNPTATVLDAQNAVCEKFLMDYEESNLLLSLQSKFRTVQFFAVSALGHNANNKPFVSVGVDDPLFWLIDKNSNVIDLKAKWGKKL